MEQYNMTSKEWESQWQNRIDEIKRRIESDRDWKVKRENTNFEPGEKVWVDKYNEISNRYVRGPAKIVRKCWQIFTKQYIVQEADGSKYKVIWYHIYRIEEENHDQS